jgi:hypothetical protein
MSFSGFLEWFHERPGNFWKTIGALTIIFLLGVFLTFVLPSWAKNSAIEMAQQSISLANENHEVANQEYTIQQGWFEEAYVSQIPGLFRKVKEDLDSAELLLAEASVGFSVDTSVEKANLAKNSAEKASQTIGQINGILKANRDVCAQARKQLQSVNTDMKALGILLDSVASRFAEENTFYLKKYTSPMVHALSSAAEKKIGAENNIALATSVLPPDEESNHRGDPLAALQNFDAASALIIEINTLAAQVTAGLDYQHEALIMVGPTIEKADGAIILANGHMEKTINARGYTKDKALAAADTLLHLSIKQRDQAKSIKLIVVEDGKFDAPGAYEAAKSAVQNATDSYQEIDRQMAFEDAAREALASYQSYLQLANASINQAEIDQQTLTTNHASDIWFAESGYVGVAYNNIELAERHRQAALIALDLRQQRFFDADQESKSAITALSNSTDLSKAVSVKAAYLENFRREWPSVHSRTQNTINAEAPQVQMYGSYDWAAKNDFDSSVTLLSQAEREASSRYYEPAVNNAKKAMSLVSGTGSRCYNSYEEHKRREEEEARRRAAEEAERQRQLQEQMNSHNNSDYGSGGGDYGGGGSSGGYGGGNSGDGGDFSGGGGNSGDGGDW